MSILPTIGGTLWPVCLLIEANDIFKSRRDSFNLWIAFRELEIGTPRSLPSCCCKPTSRSFEDAASLRGLFAAKRSYQRGHVLWTQGLHLRLRPDGPRHVSPRRGRNYVDDSGVSVSHVDQELTGKATLYTLYLAPSRAADLVSPRIPALAAA